MVLRFFFLCFGVTAAVMLAGCGDGKDGSVSGKVSFNGASVTGGSLLFTPVGEGSEVGKSATAAVQSDGTYVLGTDTESDGAKVGRYKVSYSPPVEESTKELAPGESLPASAFDGLIPSKAEVEVVAGQNTIDIELQKSK